MNRKLYTILDIIANAIGPIMIFRHDAAAIRSFTEIISNKDTMVHRHPNDHKLVCLGELDDETHELSHELGYKNAPREVFTGAQWVATQPPSPQLSLIEGER